MKLSYKIFAAHVLVSFLLFFLTMTTLKVYAFKELKAFIARNEARSLNVAAEELAQRYDPVAGWSTFENSPKELEIIIERAFKMSQPLFPDPEPESGPGPDHPERNHMGHMYPIKPMPGHMEPREAIRPMEPPQPRHLDPGLQPKERIALYDVEKKYLAGSVLDIEQLVFEPIQVNGEPAGWLGLLKAAPGPHPRDKHGLQQKLHAFYLIGFFIFALTGIVSYFLSRHLLLPIKKLTLGTKALTRFNFDVKIDVTTHDELGQLGRDFNTMAETLRSYETMRKQWMLDISHELRTPISILKGETEAMLDGIRKIELERIRSLHSEICHLETMVNDLHYLSQEDARVIIIEKQLICPVSILQEVLCLFTTRLAASSIKVINGLTCKDFMIKGDGDRLRQLFTNLVENSLRYMDKPGTLTVWQENDTGSLFLYLEDSGPGVPEESVGRLFDRLYRVDSSRSRQKGGTGLGLSICKTIVKAHGGTIFAMNIPEKGLRIKIKLPLADQQIPL